MQSPSTFFPNATWPFERAHPKAALNQSQAAHANQLSLNAIEFVHWCAFPAGFLIAEYIFTNSQAISGFVGGDVSRVFFLMLGMLCQVMGGICGIQIHMYEGWQVAPFRNLLQLSDNDPSTGEPTSTEINEIRTPNYNNAWLRAVAYHLLFTFQTWGLGFSLGVFGYSTPTLGLMGVSVAVPLLLPRKPQLSEAEPRWFWRVFCERKINGVVYPILPLSVWLFITFMINTLVSLYAYKVLFGPMLAVWPPSLLPFLGPLKSEWWAVVPPVVVAVGGFIEGYFAESGFDQWVHGLAVAVLCVGVLMHYPVYWHLVHFTPPMV